MRRIRTVLAVIALSNLVWALGFRLWEAVFTNFAREELALGADQLGWVQAIREVPGLLGILVGVAALYVLEMRIAGVSVLLMGVGIALTAVTYDLYTLIGVTLLMSTGFHFFYASNASAVLLTVGRDEAPMVLGRLNSLGALASLLGTAVIVATLGRWGYRNLFLVTGIVVTVAALVLLPFGRQGRRRLNGPRRPPLRRRYWLYYALQFLHGSRRHIFTTFAVFLMVSAYGVPAQTMALLYLVNYLLGTYLHQAFGGIVARFGERRVLTVNSILLAVIFLGYAFLPLVGPLQRPAWRVPTLGVAGWLLFPTFSVTPVLLVLMVLFVADNILFGFSIALECYFQKIALGPEEITANVAMGQTMNHIAAVVIPVLGGVVWVTLGPQYTFLAGVVIVLVALGLTQNMRVPSRESGPDARISAAGP
jgi:predicted MFS family arabinose efflux permease